MLKTRLAEPIDLVAISAFDAFPGDRIVEIMERRMLVVDVDSKPQGYVSWQKNGCIVKDYVNKLVVSDQSRGKGLAKQLISALAGALTGRVFISAADSNVAAIRLLEGTQWIRAGQITGLLPSGEAEILFYKDLRSEPLR